MGNYKLPFGTHRDSPYDDMEKFRYLPTVMRTGAQREDCFGLVMASFPSISEYMYVIFILYLTEDLQCSLSPRKKIRVSEKMWFWSLKGWNFQTATQPRLEDGCSSWGLCNMFYIFLSSSKFMSCYCSWDRGRVLIVRTCNNFYLFLRVSVVMFFWSTYIDLRSC